MKLASYIDHGKAVVIDIPEFLAADHKLVYRVKTMFAHPDKEEPIEIHPTVATLTVREVLPQGAVCSIDKSDVIPPRGASLELHPDTTRDIFQHFGVWLDEVGGTLYKPKDTPVINP